MILVTFYGVDKVVNNDDIVLLFEKLDDGVGTHVPITKTHQGTNSRESIYVLARINSLEYNIALKKFKERANN